MGYSSADAISPSLRDHNDCDGVATSTSSSEDSFVEVLSIINYVSNSLVHTKKIFNKQLLLPESLSDRALSISL